jgi:hypothetical protein
MKDKWYNPQVHTGWHKSQGTVYRRRLAVHAHKGDYLATARAMDSLARVTKDSQTARLAKADANYFYKKHKETGR